MSFLRIGRVSPFVFGIFQSCWIFIEIARNTGVFWVLANTPALLNKAAVLLIHTQNQRLQGACVNKVSQCVICQSLNFCLPQESGEKLDCSVRPCFLVFSLFFGLCVCVWLWFLFVFLFARASNWSWKEGTVKEDVKVKWSHNCDWRLLLSVAKFPGLRINCLLILVWLDALE